MLRPVGAAQTLEARFFAFLHARFPPHAIVTLSVFALAGVGYGAALLGRPPSLEALIIGLVVLVTLSFQLAVGDALRDETHAGGVWNEPLAKPALLILAVGAAGVQCVLTLALHPPLLGPLALAWLAIILASQDFFITDLAKRPALSVGLHLTGLASAGYYVAGAEIFRQTGQAHAGLLGFVGLTVAAGLALEIARKSEAPIDERPGVQTYSKTWGGRQAGMAVAAALIAALLGATIAYLGLGAFPGRLLPVVAIAALAYLAAIAYAFKPQRAAADQMRLLATLFVISAYIALGAAPFLLRLLGWG